MDQPNVLNEIDRLLLMAAAVQGLGPDTNLSRANTARVINQALLWLGLSPEEIKQGWWDAEEHWGEKRSDNEQVYDVLVQMVHQTEMRLFQGNGNWGVPGKPDCPACWPHFNSCRLTAHGEQVALELLAQHPEYRKSAEDQCGLV